MLPSRVAIVGAGGFIGSHLLESLLKLGVQVEGIDLQEHRIEHLKGHANLTWVNEDYTAPGFSEALAERHDVVINLAALCNPSLYNTRDLLVIHSNFNAPAHLAECCAQSKTWLISFSTSEVYGYGDRTSALVEDSSPMVLGPVNARRWSYATAKLLLERWLVGLEHEMGLAWTVVRPFNVLGPHMDYVPGVDGEGIPRVMANFATALLKGKPMSLVNGGVASRAFTWVGDAVDAVIRILKNRDKAVGQCFHVGNPRNEIDICGLAERMAYHYDVIRAQQGLKTQLPPLANPTWIEVSGQDFYGAGYEDSERRLPDIAKARDLLGWNPSTDLDETLKRSLQWFVEYYG